MYCLKFINKELKKIQGVSEMGTINSGACAEGQKITYPFFIFFQKSLVTKLQGVEVTSGVWLFTHSFLIEIM